MEDKSIPVNETKPKQDDATRIEDPFVMEEIEIEELSVDGICGVY